MWRFFADVFIQTIIMRLQSRGSYWLNYPTFQGCWWQSEVFLEKFEVRLSGDVSSQLLRRIWILLRNKSYSIVSYIFKTNEEKRAKETILNALYVYIILTSIFIKAETNFSWRGCLVNCYLVFKQSVFLRGSYAGGDIISGTLRHSDDVRYQMEACVRWLHDGSSNMAVLEFNLLTGFRADLESIERVGSLSLCD